MPLKYGLINYRKIIRRALQIGCSGPFCCEHYGSDPIGVCAENSEYIWQALTSAENSPLGADSGPVSD